MSTPLLEMRNIKKDFFGNQVLTDINLTLTADQVPTDGILLRKGKKNYCRVILK